MWKKLVKARCHLLKWNARLSVSYITLIARDSTLASQLKDMHPAHYDDYAKSMKVSVVWIGVSIAIMAIIYDVRSSDDGSAFCSPQGGVGAVGGYKQVTATNFARIDTDGDPNAKGHDPDWQPDTSVHITSSGRIIPQRQGGQALNAKRYAYVVLNAQMQAEGINLGDWFQVTCKETALTTWARIGDYDARTPAGEISEATADAIGIKYTPNSWTVGNPSVTLVGYAGSGKIPGDCPPYSHVP
jgi:hypothetical protein